ncbi:MAG: hypothetical protein J7L72_12595 [Candidatus Aminicenantes bacterium]|nr:hypothetical protein [Candidatus Aminicenantes bacterium]
MNTKRLIILMGVLALSLALFAQEIEHDEIVVNIEVPVRVFDKDRFVDNLTIDDFEVYENGKLQKITACYVIKKTKIERKEEKEARMAPDVSRNFVLLFDIWEYFPKVEKAIDLFFENVVLEGDSLIVITPVKAYNLKDISWDYQDKEQIAEQLKKIVRKDTIMGNAEYRNTLRELEQTTSDLNAVEGIKSLYGSGSSLPTDDANSLDYILQKYRTILTRLNYLRDVDEQELARFAELLKDRSGQKIAFFFSQREMVAQPMPKIIASLESRFQDKHHILMGLHDLFSTYREGVSIDADKIKKAFSDSSILIHFLYITKPAEYKEGILFKEHSEDIFKAFSGIARSTGGLTESSANAEASFQKAVTATESYYLLYYRPSAYKRDGKFKNIKVKVKAGSYKITHRSGYIAN